MLIGTAIAQRDSQPARRVEGTVVDVLGDPIPKARLTVTCRDRPSHFLLSDGLGRFVVGHLPASAYRLTVQADRHCGRTESIDTDSLFDSSLRITLLDGVVVSGRVLDGNGRPIQDAHVLVDAPWKPLIESETHAVTDANGHYELAHVPVGGVRLVALAPGHLTATESMTVARPATRDFTLRAGPAVTYRIHVDSADDEDWSKLGVSMLHRFTESDVCWRLGAIWPRTRDGDHIVLTDLPIDLAVEQIAIHFGKHASSPEWHHPPGTPGTHEFTTRVVREPDKAVPVTIRGVVHNDGGQPVRGLHLHREHGGATDATITADDGSFQLATSLVDGGRFELDIDDDGYLIHAAPRDWRARTAYQGRHDGDRVHHIVVQRSTRVTGRIVDALAVPVFGAEVALLINEYEHERRDRSTPRRVVAWVKTGRDGSFVLPRVNGRSDFSHWLTVNCAAGRLHLGPLRYPPQGPLHLDPVQLGEAGGIEGVFTDAQGHPEPGREVCVWHDGVQLPSMQCWSGYTNREGRFRFLGLPAGDFHVRAGEPHASRWTPAPDFAFLRLQAGEHVIVEREDERR